MRKNSGLRPGFSVLSVVLLLLAPAAAILYGVYGLDNRKYLLVSLVILACAILSFFLLFEQRKPPARDLVTLAVLCSIAVAGRAAFFMLPQFKPVAAVVILTGVCLGGQAGFLVGAVSALVSNFFFGQGPNTPFQMFAFGLVGLLAGLFFRHARRKPKKLFLCVYGALSVFILYGGVVNGGTLLISGLPLTPVSYLTVCASGIPFDLTHAAATAFFLFVLSGPMMEKMERMKQKYGLMQRDDDSE
jgi:energy-coupling factor transport system substrate-specific component